VVSQHEISAAVLEPHFDAVRDVFAGYCPEPGAQLDLVKRTKMLVDPTVHDTYRHFACCRDDDLLIELAPEAADLPLENLVAILAHEVGHAVDFLYPGMWAPPSGRGGPAIWIGDEDSKPARIWRGRLWHERSTDQVEQAADAIGQAVTGRRISYCGPCMIQCFSGGRSRPRDLR